MTSRRPVRALTVAGSDSGGGAGIQADLKTFAAHGVYGMSAITAVTAQNTRGVSAIHPVPPTVVEAQLDAVFTDLGADAVKIGMLGAADVVEVVATSLERHGEVPLVLDPVMVAKSGDRLLAESAEMALGERLLPMATLVTPNLPEAEALLGRSLVDLEARRRGAEELARRGPAVLLKGGHGTEDVVIDLLASEGELLEFRHRRVETRSDHGTGCTLSAAIAAQLARGAGLTEAVSAGLEYLAGALITAVPVGGGRGPVNHCFPGSYAGSS